jgi:hypothetical protein
MCICGARGDLRHCEYLVIAAIVGSPVIDKLDEIRNKAAMP